MPNILSGVNPLTRVYLMLALTLPLFLSVDWVSAAVSLVITFVFAPLCGVSWGKLMRSGWFLFILAALSGVSMLLYGAEGGEVYFRLWLIVVSENSVTLSVAMMLRVLAVALPMIVLARDIDPSRLGDALAQNLRLPSRFVIGAVAGVRMATLFRDDWDSMARARRARGLGDRGKVKHLLTMSFGLLVVALRRGGKLATAMEARGFGRTPLYSPSRTWARESRVSSKDWLIMLAGSLLAAVPVVASVVTDSWRFFGL